MSGWGKNLAEIWTNNVAPSRPSHAEFRIYNRYLCEVRKKLDRPVELLVLGSTPEFRDWGFEQDMAISVVDYNVSYYETISRELRHKNLVEHLYVSRWEDMVLNKEFDIIIGDLTIGNVEPSRFEDFIMRIREHLSPEGYFLGKSFLWDGEEKIKKPLQIIDEYNKYSKMHPYTYINHQLGLYCLDKSSCTIDFQRMFYELEYLHLSGKMSDKLFAYFQNVGWNSEMKFKFFAPSKKMFVDMVNGELNFICYEYTEEIYTSVFPIYIIKQKGR